MAMKTRNGKLQVRALALAVEAVLVAMFAMPARADDAGVAALTMPTNSMEAGILYTPKDSAKFGEYSGIDKSGGYLNGNFNIRGGDAYGDICRVEVWGWHGGRLGRSSGDGEGAHSAGVGFPHD